MIVRPSADTRDLTPTASAPLQDAVVKPILGLARYQLVIGQHFGRDGGFLLNGQVGT